MTIITRPESSVTEVFKFKADNNKFDDVRDKLEDKNEEVRFKFVVKILSACCKLLISAENLSALKTIAFEI